MPRRWNRSSDRRGSGVGGDVRVRQDEERTALQPPGSYGARIRQFGLGAGVYRFISPRRPDGEQTHGSDLLRDGLAGTAVVVAGQGGE